MNRLVGAEAITAALRHRAGERPGLVPFLTGGFPDAEQFERLLPQVSACADVLEIGIPFSDPMADGLSIQRSSQIALENGASLAKILASLAGAADALACPVVLMSYFNPLLAYGLERLAADARAAGVSGFIVPDLPLEECAEFREVLEAAELALIQLVTPVTPESRIDSLAEACSGFLYAVTMTGTTGKKLQVDQVTAYLDRLRAHTDLPVCAGFGIQERAQVEILQGHADAVIVGSALIDVIMRGEDPLTFLRSLKHGVEPG
ncbi:MAG: tryptophan synthase subunit alpha [Planctomycetota bacterium]|jgi:tryptophan synthase alpha chain